MGSAVALGLGMAALSGISTFAGEQQNSARQRAQASALHAQADIARQQGELAEQKGRIEAQTIDRRKSDIRRRFNEQQGHNRSLLAAGNVDMTSGSALDVSTGNINRFAEDMGENAWQKALSQWETAQQAKSARYQADVYDAQGSYLKRTAGNLGTSLLSAAISGGSGFLSGYAMGGGSLSGLWKSDWDDTLGLAETARKAFWSK